MAAAPVTLEGLNVLVVDDNDDARVLLRRVLSEASANVVDVSSVMAAMEMLNEFSPDILLSDLAMPGQDGLDLIHMVREAGWSPERLPAIALSAYAREGDRRRAIQAGFQNHLSKPPDISKLLRAIVTLTAAR